MKYLPAFITIIMPITKVFSSHPIQIAQEGLNMPTQFPFMDYRRALIDTSQCIYTQGKELWGEMQQELAPQQGHTQALPPAWGAVVVPSPSALPTPGDTFTTDSVRRKNNCTYQS